ncbi:hypothetical protein N7510_001363 [Penicillium lagena]|uniref:uncharacterized protein n=1 Tax=Penicillium lagena TaxID=94218 RepID=UPI0025422BF8|nr:uncharacterized protein N7510_001363 [Penicillium lagena]KAJ5625054.1 hypothetical protein N7510_001363 [Penicillium lagena]
MGSVTYRDGISILELIVYLPSFFVAAFLVSRHGFRKTGGFIFLAIFTIFRLVGACCELATINKPSTGLYVAAAICSSIGLSPLLMACSGMLSRVNESIENNTTRPVLPELAFSFFRIITIVAMVLSIVGITSNMSLEGLKHPDIEVKIGMILYLVSWAILIAYLGIFYMRRYSVEKGEKRNMGAVAISAPFLLVRIIYAMLVWFIDNDTFDMLTGNVTVQLVMSVLEEIAVVIVCLGVGMTLKVRGRSARKHEEARVGGYMLQGR